MIYHSAVSVPFIDICTEGAVLSPSDDIAGVQGFDFIIEVSGDRADK
jgi:hypothetical protein